MLDQYNRRIDYLRISVTDRCNLRCTYCMPAEGVVLTHHSDVLGFEQIAEVVRAGVRLGITKVRLTGGEPLVRRDIVSLVRMLAAISGLEKLAMTTNGFLLPRYATELKDAGLQSVNISLDTLDAERYASLTRGGQVDLAVAGVSAAIEAGFSPIKINTVVSKETTEDEIRDLRIFCEERGIQLQRIREYNLSARKTDDDAFDRPPPCVACNRLRLTANGRLKPCLHSNIEIPVNFDSIEDSLLEAVGVKPFHGAACTNRSMMSIGG